MYKMTVEYENGKIEKHVFSSKKEAENFVDTLDYWNVDIWIGINNIMVEWNEKFYFGW